MLTTLRQRPQRSPRGNPTGPAHPRQALRGAFRRAAASATIGAVAVAGLPMALDHVTGSHGQTVGGTTRTVDGQGVQLVALTRAVVPSRGATLPQIGHRPVPKRATTKRGYRRISPDARRVIRYRVRPGDTASGLAVRFHAWTDELVAMNGSVLVAGERIRIPVVLRAAARDRRHRATSRTGATHSKQAGNKQAGKERKAHKATKHVQRSARAKRKRARREAAPRPSRYVVRRVVARTARRHGVDPQLALAVAWQESGWQMHLTSSAGALGAMQVIPSTGRWMSDVVGRRLHLRDLRDNATAGVVYLKLLRSQAPRRVAVAGYYQGLAGVRRHGMYSDTVRYVANVLALKRAFERGRYPV